MSNNKEKLFTEFTAPTTQEWLDKIEVDLKGADFQKRLVWRTNEGFNVQPFYRREDLKDLKSVDSLPGEFPYVRGNKKDNNLWFVRQDIDAEDAKAANAKALDILNKGGTKKLNKGVRVDVTENSVNTQVSVILDFGYNIPVTSSNIQNRVKNSLESMTGLTVTDVNVRIVGVEMPKEEE